MNRQQAEAPLALLAALCGFGVCAAEPAPTPTTCAITRPNGGMFGNESLSVVLPDTRTLIFRPGGPGFVDDDGALGMKVGWGLHERGTLFVTGRRLDGVASPARAYTSRGYDNYIGGMSLYLVFPTPDCWEITGTLNEASLTFIVQVGKIGDGPRRLHGPPRGWRVATPEDQELPATAGGRAMTPAIDADGAAPTQR